MRRILLTIFLTGALANLAFATHNRAGEITFRHISGYTFEVTVTTFTYTESAANRSELTVQWGDNTSSIAPLVSRTVLPNFYFHNIYITKHTFPGPGIYEIMMQDPNRNFGIENIPNSVNVVFSIKTTFIISPEIGDNNTPVLLNFPIDRAARGHLFIHNPAAYDSDGDSLSYKMTVCTGIDGKPIANYTLPEASDTLYVDAVTGDFVWYSPVDTGKYNVAINIEEWRQGVKIGNIVRDMQIDVVETGNNPPVNPAVRDICVLAGELVEFDLMSTDADGDSVRQQMNGGPFTLEESPAGYNVLSRVTGASTLRFTWQTTCDHIRKQPYQVILRSVDNNRDVNLTDIDNFNIRVIAPAPVNLKASSTSEEIDLSWNKSRCGPVKGYYVYRKEGSFDFTQDSCQTGIPAGSGYVRIASMESPEDTLYTDDNRGEGLAQGVQYCYRITAVYDNGYESRASEESCASLVPGFPSILNVSVTVPAENNGNIFISWVRPSAEELTEAPGPYVIQIFRSRTYGLGEMVLVDSIITATLDVNTYNDILNTADRPYYYTVRIINNTPGNRFVIRQGEEEIASSLYVEIKADDNRLTLEMHKKAPWINTSYIIYRYNDNTGVFDSIGVTESNIYVDDSLKNGTTYAYRAESIGRRTVNSVVYNNSNLSHISSGTPLDITPPCAPVLQVASHCDSFVNVLTWTNPNRTCADDVIRYNIYYTNNIENPPDSLTSVSPASDTVFIHHLDDTYLVAGCYFVTAVDSFENESAHSVQLCVDECISYELPNVFTPNGDGFNDIFYSNNPGNVIKQVDMKIFNRYGQLVFETADPQIAWDGKYGDSKNPVASGVYYYVCDVYEPRITGTEIRNIVGFIHVYSEGHSEEITK
jgi:gliding motility-associated-like protein